MKIVNQINVSNVLDKKISTNRFFHHISVSIIDSCVNYRQFLPKRSNGIVNAFKWKFIYSLVVSTVTYMAVFLAVYMHQHKNQFKFYLYIGFFFYYFGSWLWPVFICACFIESVCVCVFWLAKIKINTFAH